MEAVALEVQVFNQVWVETAERTQWFQESKPHLPCRAKFDTDSWKFSEAWQKIYKFTWLAAKLGNTKVTTKGKTIWGGQGFHVLDDYGLNKAR